MNAARALAALAVTAALSSCGGRSDGTVRKPVVYDECEVNSDCVVIPASCCGTCGAPTRGDAVAINVDRSAAYRNEACGSDKGCPACAPLFVDPTLLATCRGSRCELVDLQGDPMTACTSDTDCGLRPPDCCECGGDTSPGRLLGLSKDGQGEYAGLVCDPDQACPECEPIYPTEATVSCAGGYCRVDDRRLP